ncbi:MAG: winged helix-turn-helix domain-containing protein [Nanoarchaeota archaeon]|nr:winged helix-turn-helix domain-containing protein [Nanoarchaeota archaeon]
MWKLAKGNAFLPTTSIRRLQTLYDKEKNVNSKLRLLSAVHRKRGESIDKIAYLLSKPRRTVHGWLTRFQERGISGKDSIKQTGRPVTLTLTQRKNLVKDLERAPPHNATGLWSTKELKVLLKRKYHVEFVNQHVWRLLVSLGFSMQRPRKQHYKKPGEEEITQFKKKPDEKLDITVRKDLLWAHRMKQHLA